MTPKSWRKKGVARLGLGGIEQLSVQPGACVIPMPISSWSGNSQRLSGLFNVHSREVAQLHQLKNGGILEAQLFECLVNSQQLIGRRLNRHVNGIDVDALASKLQSEGAASFVKSWNELMGVIASKSAVLTNA